MRLLVPFYAVLVVCLVFLAGAPYAYAQAPVSAQEPAPATNDLSNVPDEYIEEALAYHDYCESRTNLSHYQDCECLAARYLDQRIEMGPKAERSAIMMAIEGKCPDATEAAGYHYNNCMSNGPLMPQGIPLEDFCECFASTYAKLYEALPKKANPSTFVHLQTQAMVTCRDPQLAKKLYPYSR